MGSAKNSPYCLPIYPEICSHSYFLLSVPFWNSSRGVGSLPFLYWITVVYMNYTRPYGNLSQFSRGKTSFLPSQSEEKQVRARAYRQQCPRACSQTPVTTSMPNVTSRKYRKWYFKGKSSPVHTCQSTPQLLSRCLYATSSGLEKNQTQKYCLACRKAFT